MVMTASDYITRLASRSKTPQHELILECLDEYGLFATCDLTMEQAAQFWEIVRRREQ